MAGNTPCTAIAITTALDGDTVVARIENTIFDNYAVARFGITTVSIRTTIDKMNTAHNKICTEKRVECPERRILHRYPFYQHSIATIQVHELRTHTVLHGHQTFVNRLPGFAPSQQLGTTTAVLSYHTFFPTVLFRTTHRPPCLHRTLSINNTFTGDRQIGLTISIYQRAHIIAIYSFPAGKDSRHIQFGIGIELQHGSFFEVEIDIAFQRDGTGIESSFGHNDRTPTGLITCNDSQIDGIMARSLRHIGFRTEIGNVVRSFRERSFFNRLFKFRSLFPCILRRNLRRNQGRNQESAQKEQVFFHTHKFIGFLKYRIRLFHPKRRNKRILFLIFVYDNTVVLSFGFYFGIFRSVHHLY